MTDKALTDARRVLEQLEEKREAMASRFASVERDRSSIVLRAMTGDNAAKTEADRLAAELANISTDAVDCEAALALARKAVTEAQAAVDAANKLDRQAEARDIVAAQLADSARIDAMFSEIAALLQIRGERCSKLRKLGVLESNRPLHASRIAEAMVQAGLRQFVGGVVARGQALAESDATTLPFGRKLIAAA
jgi:hypothetical protein